MCHILFYSFFRLFSLSVKVNRPKCQFAWELNRRKMKNAVIHVVTEISLAKKFDIFHLIYGIKSILISDETNKSDSSFFLRKTNECEEKRGETVLKNGLQVKRPLVFLSWRQWGQRVSRVFPPLDKAEDPLFFSIICRDEKPLADLLFFPHFLSSRLFLFSLVLVHTRMDDKREMDCLNSRAHGLDLLSSQRKKNRTKKSSTNKNGKQNEFFEDKRMRSLSQGTEGRPWEKPELC